jgi:hypothetical protein
MEKKIEEKGHKVFFPKVIMLAHCISFAPKYENLNCTPLE